MLFFMVIFIRRFTCFLLCFHNLLDKFLVQPDLYMNPGRPLGPGLRSSVKRSSHLALYNVQSANDDAMFVHSSFHGWTFLLLYVNDMIVARVNILVCLICQGVSSTILE